MSPFLFLLVIDWIMKTCTKQRRNGILSTQLEDLNFADDLGSIIDKYGGIDADVKARIGKARGVFIQLKNIWSFKVLSLSTKIRLLKSVLLY